MLQQEHEYKLLLIFTEQDSDGSTLMEMIADIAEFENVLPKAGDRLAIKKIAKKLLNKENVVHTYTLLSLRIPYISVKVIIAQIVRSITNSLEIIL